MSGYEEFNEKDLITHRLASAYGWTYKQIWHETPYTTIKALCKILDKLEKDQDRFVSPIEAAIFKCLLRMYPPKKD